MHFVGGEIASLIKSLDILIAIIWLEKRGTGAQKSPLKKIFKILKYGIF